MPKISQIDEVACQAEVRILQKITLKYYRLLFIKVATTSVILAGTEVVYMTMSFFSFF